MSENKTGSIITTGFKILGAKGMLIVIVILFLIIIIPACGAMLNSQSNSIPYPPEDIRRVKLLAEQRNVNYVEALVYYYYISTANEIPEDAALNLVGSFVYTMIEQREVNDANGNIVYDENGNAVMQDGIITKVYSLNQKLQASFFSEEEILEAHKIYALWDMLLSGQTVSGLPDGYVVPDGEFVWPAPSVNTVTSKYGPRWGREHHGVDLSGSNPTGTPVVAASAGEVYEVNTDPDHACGLYVRVDHQNGYQTRYCHLSSISVGNNTMIEKGGLLGGLGNTGNSTGAHLHFEMKINGSLVDPLPYIIGTKP